MKIIILLVLLVITTLISGCVGQQYVCPDGTVVFDPSMCLTTTIMTTTTTPITTTTSTTTTTPITLVTTVSKGICEPCFDYFAYVRHDDTVLIVKNGESRISIDGITYTQYKNIEILHGCTKFPCNVNIHYADLFYNTTHTDTATLK